MKKKLSMILALMIAASMVGTTGAAFAEAAPPEGTEAESAGESQGGEDAGASEGEGSGGESAEGEDAGGESAEGEDAGGESAEGESAEGESAEGENAGGESAEGESAGADQAAEPAADEPDYSMVQDYEYSVVEADGNQARLTYIESVTPLIEADGLLFKDMNNNGSLDTYEDWRADIEDRITDLISQMTIEEKSGLFYHICSCGNSTGADFSLPQNIWGPDKDGAVAEDSHSMAYYINELQVTHFLDNSNGTPDAQVGYHNAIQSIGERTRLGIPITFSSDRQYNAWGGMIDTPHSAFGTAADTELGAKLWAQYAAETRAVGYHVVFHPYGMEIGSWNGESPEYVAAMTTAEVSAIEGAGLQACAKHYIARGGDSSFEAARSDAQTVDNWMYPWQAAVDCGIQWIMLNADKGLSNEVVTDYDKISLDYLRDELGFDGITLSDWGTEGSAEGIGYDGTDLSTLSIPERYAYAVNAGLDQIGFPNTAAGDIDDSPSPSAPSHRDAIQQAYEQGLITEERLEETCRRVLKAKFSLGLFEDPYCDADAALALAASDEYIADPWELTDLESLNAARNPEVVELERQLEAKGAVLIKNEDDLLPLEKGIKVYIGTTASAITLEGYIAALGEYATVVEDIEDADVVIADCTQINDAAELIVMDAQDAGKPVVIATNNVKPDEWTIENGDAVLFLNFSRTPDHGSGEAGFILTTEPCVFADLMFGERVPEGMIVKEIARDSLQESEQWKDLAGDMGADTYVQLILLGTMKKNADHSVPNNYGDPLLCFKYGMRYGEHADFAYDTLILPKTTQEVTEETSSGTSTSYVSKDGAKAGEPFTIYMLMWNNGADGLTTVDALIDGELVNQQIMAINSGDWRIMTMDLVIDTAGEHTVQVGDIVKTIVVE